jgi:hypothetical protein
MVKKNLVLIVSMVAAFSLILLGTVNISAATTAFSQIEAESFDSQSGIQTESCSDSGGGRNIGYIANGDYAVYSGINFGGGAASFNARAASATGGGTIEIRLDSLSGTPVGTCVIPGTGGWQNWTTQTCSINGAGGVHTVYLKFTGGSGDLMNVNWFKFVAGNAGTTVSAFSQIEAESFGSQSGIQTESCSDSGGGRNIGYIANGDYAVYSGMDFGGGAASFNVRAASATGGGNIEIRLDSLSGTLIGACTIPGTGGWQNWTTQTCSINGAGGVHTIYLKFTGGSGDLMNVNWFKFSTSNATPPSPSPSKCKWAGVRESKYGVDEIKIGFPSPQGWANAMNHMASHWNGSAPTAIWLVGEVDFGTTGTTLQFTSPGGNYDSLIKFNPSGVDHESCLNYFDQQGIQIFLQLEPGFASITDQINAVLRKFGHHPCVAGLAIDIEWYKHAGDNGMNAYVSDALAKQWEAQVKSFNSRYWLLLKHFEERYLPPTYRGDIIFCCDDEQNGSLNSFLSEHRTMAEFCYPNPVIYQIGYPSDKSWWGRYSDPPQVLGDALINQTRDGQECGVIWVDFSLDILPH